ncbi:isocitrate lyase/PEP mutase family protein [Pseudoxanthomonas indica]|uniref:2-Methylisocitrate lyase, PEP mutase family n=1 Tax=Pseudoxanthomonas indica TaxID=428993 RepID=A0A1T5LYQ9_9GAMM|nr:isocitrate lyase/phosphoenolpyruvate mutase family protein [Pseudoxanthomonas indica]GGD42363.1 hypothetical protein GCM10007235_12990 [Pseudoxanthomonas indica]SKC80995.1 2-Methylisocitrate lyase, PEP mutase family [Pseudoxanthomonas indica]
MIRTAEHTAHFRHLHADGVLRLANAWDAGTARLLASLGSRAIATTSAGVAWAQGYGDGNQLPLDRVFDSVESIARVIDVPLSVDFEAGYSDDADSVADAVLQLVRRGVSGINLEDSGREPALLAAKIKRIRERCAQEQVDVFVNARTDVYLRQLAAPGEPSIQATLERARVYREAGADGLFVPGVTAEADIRAIAGQAGLPVNVLWRAALPAVDVLSEWGVRRLSAGSALVESALGHLRERASAFLEQPRIDADATALPYGQANALFNGP